jgi:hypothetical protein
MHIISQSFPFQNHKIGKILFLATLLSACNSKGMPAVPLQVDGEDAVPSRMPTKKQMYEITAPLYKAPNGVRQECFGRLVFDVYKNIEWPLFFNPNSYSFFNRRFSAKVGSAGDEMRFGKIMIAVIGSVGSVRKEKILEDTPSALLANLEADLEATRNYISELKSKSDDSEKNIREIKEQNEWVDAREKQIKRDRAEFEIFDSGLPNSEGYWMNRSEASDASERYSVLRAYLARGEYIYVFESSVKMEKPSDKEAHKKDFSAMLAKFRTRAPNEIPTDPGVCIPHGFIPDDGKTVVEFKQSLRFTDAPGVLYTIETGTVHPRRLKLTPLLAAAHVSINPPPTAGEDEVRPVVTQRIGPKIVKIGGLSGEQGGVVLKVDQPRHEKYEMYSVFSGYAGWLGTLVLPYILVEMHTVTKEQAPELKQNPPPFKPSMDRLDLLLRSMRWRPTNPSMPEFEDK